MSQKKQTTIPNFYAPKNQGHTQGHQGQSRGHQDQSQGRQGQREPNPDRKGYPGGSRYGGSSDSHSRSTGDFWDAKHVRMPCSRHNITKGPGGNRAKWDEIHDALVRVDQQELCKPEFIVQTILNINPAHRNKWNLTGLVEWFNGLPGTLSEFMMKQGFQYIARAALRLPTRVSNIPFLEPGQVASVELKQSTIVSLLANMFFCTFPQRNTKSDTLATVNFNRLFECAGTYPDAAAKLTMISQYFITWCQRECMDRQYIALMDGLVLYSRRYLTPETCPDFASSQKQILRTEVRFDGRIENCDEALQVDFANKFIGGGVLGRGAVQEEIRMAICPEMIVARLFTPVLENHEALFFKGVEQYSQYKGYSRSLEFVGAFNDERRDDTGSFHTEVVAIDATYFSPEQKEYQWDMEDMIPRELYKAYIGFRPIEKFSKKLIATGNWGCGAFNGDVELKAIIQILAGSECCRELIYVIVDEKQEEWSEKLKVLVNALISAQATVSQLYHFLENFCASRDPNHHSLFDYILSSLKSGQSDQPHHAPESDPMQE